MNLHNRCIIVKKDDHKNMNKKAENMKCEIKHINNPIYRRNREHFIKTNIKKDSKILDIGYVEWINFHKEIMRIGEVYGLDVLKTDIKNTYVGSGEDMIFDSNTFDTVIAGEVIEHMSSPFEFLLECKRVCNENGNIILTTPNIHNFWWNRKALLDDMFEYHPEHVHSWDIPLLKSLCKRANLSIIEYGYIDNTPTWSPMRIIYRMFPILSWHVYIILKKSQSPQ